MSPDMQAAVEAFKRELPYACTPRPQVDKPDYTLVTLDGWPRAVHYEFRDRAGSDFLYVEVHIEDPAYLCVKEALQKIAADTPTIETYALQYFDSRPWPNLKKWPSLSIAVPKDRDGEVVATVMRELIKKTRASIEAVLVTKGVHSRMPTKPRRLS